VRKHVAHRDGALHAYLTTGKRAARRPGTRLVLRCRIVRKKWYNSIDAQHIVWYYARRP